MENSAGLARRFREVLLEGRWIANTNYKEQLLGLSWEQATLSIGSLNTIAALTYHIDYYIGGVLQVLEGGELSIRDRYSFDLPPVQSAGDWNALLEKLWTHAARFADRVENLPAERLEEVFADPRYGTYRRNIEGIIEHCYYHLGQIVLIRKLLAEPVDGPEGNRPAPNG
jgi:hypothetical protein